MLWTNLVVLCIVLIIGGFIEKHQLNFIEILEMTEQILLMCAMRESKSVAKDAAAYLGLTYRSFRHYAGKYKIDKKFGGAYDLVAAEAHRMVAQSIAENCLKRPDLCSRCGLEGRIEGHHPDYTQPLMVIWLCSQCHADEHKLLREIGPS